MRIRTAKGLAATTLFKRVGIAYVAYVKKADDDYDFIAHGTLQYIVPGAPFPQPAEGFDRVPVELSHIYVAPIYRRDGLGGKIVRSCLRYSDSKGWIIVLRAEPYLRQRSGIGLDGLIDWYAGFGFTPYYEGEGCEYMVRHPETRKV